MGNLKINLEIIVSEPYLYFMPKNNTDLRKEIWLPKEVLDNAEKLATKKGWSVKKYIETLIVKHVGRYYINNQTK